MINKNLFQKILIILSPIIVAFVILLIIFSSSGSCRNPLLTVVIVMSVTLVALFLVTYLVINRYIGNIKKISESVKGLSKGDFESLEDIDNLDNNEFSDLKAFLVNTAGFFRARYKYLDGITQNQLDDEFNPDGERDLFGNKLVELADGLKNNKLEIERAIKEEEQRNWIANGLAKFNDILRLDTHDIRKLGSKLMSNLVNYIDANQGALYVLIEDELDEESEPVYELVSAIAYDREKLLKVKIGLGEGLVGHCAYERKKIYLTEIPDEYIRIGSGLGTANPNCILIVPCILDEKVYGIIELATFHEIDEYKIDFVEKLGESIASTISNVQINEKTTHLLEESKKQGEELAAQEEELRQNLEEMEATQEDLERQMKTNAKIREEISYEKFLFDTLLDHIPGRVFFKDEECRFIKASKTAAEKFGKASYHDLVGLSDADLLDPEFAKKTMADERQIMQSRQGLTEFVEHEKLDNGKEIWKTVSKIPLINEEDKCIGTFGIINDITEYKLLEIQSKKDIESFHNYMNVLKDSFLSVTINSSGIIEEANDKFCKTLNLKIGNLVGKHYSEVLDAKQQGGTKLADNWDNIINGEQVVLNGKYKVKSAVVELSEIYSVITDNENMEQKVLLIANKKD